MSRLYRMHLALPSLATLLLLVACEPSPAPTSTEHEKVPNAYLEKLQEAEALKHTIEQRNLEQQQIDQLLRDGQPGAR